MNSQKAIVIPGGAVERKDGGILFPQKNMFRDTKPPYGGVVNEHGEDYDPKRHIAFDRLVCVMMTMRDVKRKEDGFTIPMDKLAVDYIPPADHFPWDKNVGAILLNERYSRFVQDFEQLIWAEAMVLREASGRKQYFGDFSWDASRTYFAAERTVEMFEFGIFPMWDLAYSLEINLSGFESERKLTLLNKIGEVISTYV